MNSQPFSRNFVEENSNKFVSGEGDDLGEGQTKLRRSVGIRGPLSRVQRQEPTFCTR